MKFPDPLGGVTTAAKESTTPPSRFRDADVSVETPSRGAPSPGSESVGPALFDLVKETRQAYRAHYELLQQAVGSLRERNITEFATGNTDANGNLDLKLYTVPAGYQFQATRVVVEAAGFTPASPYSNSAAWIALIRGLSFAVGSILDFGPPTSGGEMIPCIFSTSANHAPSLMGGEILSLHIAGSATLATMGIWARTQGRLIAL